MQLASMLKDKIEAWVEVDGYPGFEVHLNYLARTELDKLRKKCTTSKFDRRTHQKVEETDPELFIQSFVKACINNWKGFTLEYATKLLPIEAPEDVPLKSVIEFTEENAYSLVKESSEFDTWLNEVIFDLDNFRKSK